LTAKDQTCGKAKYREKYSDIISEDKAIFYKFIDGIYIDGRKDITLLNEHDAQTGKYYHKTNTLLLLGNLVLVT